MTLKTESQTRYTVVCAGLARPWQAFVTQALPECHMLQCSPYTQQVVDLCEQAKPTILIIDEAALLSVQENQLPAVMSLSTVQVLVLSHAPEDSIYQKALAVGCSGVLSPEATPATYRKVIRAITQGELWYPRNVLSDLVRGSVLGKKVAQRRLTAREMEILSLLAMDKKNQAIADQLFISRETVRWDLRMLYSKIGVSGRVEAQRYALSSSPTDRPLRHH
jgi:DNA-binding NarL/FixJ family response regulator